LRTSSRDVFINCPFDDGYARIFGALIFVIYACGFRPRSAKELDDCGQLRLEKLYAIIEQCRFSIHDISRTELDRKTGLPRFNMPLELGIDLGAKRYGGEAQKKKRCIVLDRTKYRYQKFISDISGMDIHEHNNRPTRVIECTRDWLRNVSRRQIPAASLLINQYRRFQRDLPKLADNLGFSPDGVPYADFEAIVAEWLATKQAN
jgi:hypothetical protein